MKPSPRNDVREMYDATADSYAEMMDKEIDLPIYNELLGSLAGAIRNVAGPVIDTACGSGHMLDIYAREFDAERPLMGVDLSPAMVEIARKRLGSRGEIIEADMAHLPFLGDGAVAALLNMFAVHHVDAPGLAKCLAEWTRVLVPGGHLLVGAWEGCGAIDYGDQADLVALRYTARELTDAAKTAGLAVRMCRVEPVEDFPMDAIYLECTRVKPA